MGMQANGSRSGIARVQPSGEIDMQTWASFADQLGTAVNTGARYIDLTLDDVSFLDSNGIRVIVECANRANESGCSIHVRGASGEVRRVLEISGILGSLIDESPIPV